jgi:hypothetical protein
MTSCLNKYFSKKFATRKSYNPSPAMPYSAPVPNSIHLLSLPPLPKPGARIDLPSLAGSSDALALAEIAGRNTGKLLAVITASAADAQRLGADGQIARLEQNGWEGHVAQVIGFEFVLVHFDIDPVKYCNGFALQPFYQKNG